MKNKKKQLIKGMMLATVLGLGVGVAGDISHAAGNELSQVQTIEEWRTGKVYEKDMIVKYNNQYYKACWESYVTIEGYEPDKTASWKLINPDGSDIAEWRTGKVYEKDMIVKYNNQYYKACWESYVTIEGYEPDKTASWKLINKNGDKSAEFPKKEDEKVRKVLTLWTNNGVYFKGDKVSYEQKTYEMIDDIFSMGHQPNISPSKWQEVKGQPSDVHPDGKDAIVENTWENDLLYGNGDTVIYNKKTYEVIGSYSMGDKPDISPSKWQEVKGHQPEDNAKIMGNWDADDFYKKGDVVTHKGYKYKLISDSSISDEPNKNSGEVWTLIL
ncbi:hypothetical protein [Bacillus cereus]|uniref:hypothetical protein n=1 Tax=Bacillus cereus TaxID=1396 RepID=UPI0028526122|nr:hypothetical protein [Bacillus cereus]WLE91005.1 hypothetical protein GGBNIMDK_00036 [Bacillus cereus]